MNLFYKNIIRLLSYEFHSALPSHGNRIHPFNRKIYFTDKPEGVKLQCRPMYAEKSWWKIYNVYLTIIHYFVPMIILDTAYTMIAIKK
ncbi:hypothetical protein DICVIV_08881 [Dictyocaulus viviparus]|uniref:Uncharacterized protein n=1 Tax=Dictyocaulus viviparus TaxID=29172 RepID=A0A0D8XMN5_DICVI|nr:hypothetical protein DICVIV_08881 [Dictyocaulus viviparus]